MLGAYFIRWSSILWSADSARKRTPTVLQMEAVECGAAALGIILGYFGRTVALDELRTVCGISRDGSNASQLLKAARTYGLKAEVKRLDTAALRAHALPLILHWNFQHFLVLEGFGQRRVYLNDPACGRRTVSDAEFDLAYTGVALSFAPTENFVRAGQPASLRASLIAPLRGLTPSLTFIGLASLGLVIPGLVVPAILQIFVDQYLLAGLHDWLGALLLGLLMMTLLRSGLTWLQQQQLLRLEMHLTLHTSRQFFWHVLRLPIPFFQQRYAGEISERLRANDRLAQLLTGDLASTLANMLTLIFFALVMLQINVLLTVIGIALSVLNLYLLRRLAVLQKDASQRLQQERSKLMATTLGGIDNIESLKVSGEEGEFFSRWSGIFASVTNIEQDLTVQARLLSQAPGLLNGILLIAILLIGGLRVMAGEMSIGMLVAFQSLMSSFHQPVHQLMSLVGRQQAAGADLARLDDVLQHPLDASLVAEDARAASVRPKKLEGHLVLRDVCFGYSRLAAPLITDFSLTLAPGQRIALVGSSGSGKSTIARLVLGLYQPWSGQILFDGVPRAAYARGDLHVSLAGVEQEITLFEGSVRDNLCMWDRSLPETDMLQAARDACIHSTILSLPGAYAAQVEERGRNFSGGQAQRLEIARALARNPRILVLDEASAALDPITEKRIDEQIRRRGCACLIVAHRLSTIRDCDEIIVLERGVITERGTHAQLITQNGAYCRLIEMA